MRSVFLLLTGIAVCSASQYKIGRLDIWTNEGKSKKVYSHTAGSKIPQSTVLPKSAYAEVEIVDSVTSKKATPTQVALLFSQDGFDSTISGLLPTVQVALKASAAGGSTYRSAIRLMSRKTVNPKGGVFSVSLIAAGDDATLNESLGKVTVPASTERSIGSANSNGASKWVSDLASYFPLPVIDHMFRPPAHRADPTLSVVFSIIALVVPFLIFGFGLTRLQLNAKGLADPTSALFFAGLGAFALLIVMFFIALNLVQTVAVAIVLTVPLCIVGNRMLTNVRTHNGLGLD